MACSTLDPAKTAHRESGSKSSCCAPTVPFCAKRLAATAKPAFAFCATCAEQGSAPSTNFALPDTGQTKATDIKRKRNHKRLAPRELCCIVRNSVLTEDRRRALVEVLVRGGGVLLVDVGYNFA